MLPRENPESPKKETAEQNPGVLKRLGSMLGSIRNAILGDNRTIAEIIADSENRAIRDREDMDAEVEESKMRTEQEKDTELQKKYEASLKEGERAVRKHLGYKFVEFRDTPMAVKNGIVTKLLTTDDILTSNGLTYTKTELDEGMKDLKSLEIVLSTSGYEGVDGKDHMGEVELSTKAFNDAIKDGKITITLVGDEAEMKVV